MAKQATTVRRTVKALRDANALSSSHEALVGVALGLADAVDALGDEAPAALWKELRAAVESLVKVGGEVDDGADTSGLGAIGAAEVGDS